LPATRRDRLSREQLAEGLGALGGVDAGQADAVLDLVPVEHGEGVAVGDADDAALEGIGGGRQRGEQQEGKEEPAVIRHGPGARSAGAR